MACDQPILSNLPLLGCCAPLGELGIDRVLLYGDRSATAATAPSMADLTTIFTQLVALDFQPIPVGGQSTDKQAVYSFPLGMVFGSGVPAQATWCYPFLPDSFSNRFNCLHGYALNLPQGRIEYWGVKIRIRPPTPRRFCLTTCQHLRLSSDCNDRICDPEIGNTTTTLLPAIASMIFLPPQMAALTGRLGETRDFATLHVEVDTQPPSTPFCGLP